MDQKHLRMSSLVIERATAADIPFLVKTVQAAEQSTASYSGLARVFGVTEEDLPELVTAMFKEEVEGCEFSVSSFRIARRGAIPVAAVGGWVEGLLEDGVPSQVLRSNLIGYCFPPSSLQALRTHAEALQPMRLDRKKGTLQIEYVYVSPDNRGRGSAARLIETHIQEALSEKAPPTTAQVQVFANNNVAVQLYTALGFFVAQKVSSTHPAITSLLPHHEKLLMERKIP